MKKESLLEEDFDSVPLAIVKLRKILGMPAISFREVICMRKIDTPHSKRVYCNTPFKSQFVGEVRRQHYCRSCRYFLARQVEVPALGVRI